MVWEKNQDKFPHLTSKFGLRISTHFTQFFSRMHREPIMFLSKTLLTFFNKMLKYFMRTEIKNTINK